MAYAVPTHAQFVTSEHIQKKRNLTEREKSFRSFYKSHAFSLRAENGKVVTLADTKGKTNE